MATQIEHPFDAEITRLIATGLTQEEEAIARRYYSQKERDSMPDSAFCGPNKSFPVTSQEDVTNAAGLAGHADNPDAVRACIKRKAKANGWSLPKSWQDDSSDSDRLTDPVIIRADGNHDPMTGSHSHAHPSYGASDGDTHEHKHPHKNDADHNHAHDDPAIDGEDNADRANMPTRALLYAPITRIDPEKREVEGVATSEAVDSFKTVFSYEASKKAFQRWIERTANCREMHERKAVGKGVGVYFDDEQKKIYVRSRISRSADGENTWIKFGEGILNGYSVGATNPVWETTTRDGQTYPYLVSYDLSELSYVDNASNPDAQGLVLCRGAALTDLIDTSEESPASLVVAAPVERAGARLSSESRSALHDMRDKAMSLCGCDECQGMQKANDTDAADRAITAALERLLPAVVERLLQPVYQRQQQFLARLASQPENIPPFDTSALEERLTAIVERVASSSNPAEVRAELSAVKERVERMENQPAIGLAPIMNGARPIDKSFPLDRLSQPAMPHNDPAVMQQALDRMQGAGMLDSQDMQVKAAALLLAMQQR